MFSISRVLTYFSKNGVPRILYLISTTANGITNVRDLLSIVVWQVRLMLCKIGTSVLVAIEIVLVGDGLTSIEQFKNDLASIV